MKTKFKILVGDEVFVRQGTGKTKLQRGSAASGPFTVSEICRSGATLQRNGVVVHERVPLNALIKVEALEKAMRAAEELRPEVDMRAMTLVWPVSGWKERKVWLRPSERKKMAAKKS